MGILCLDASLVERSDVWCLVNNFQLQLSATANLTSPGGSYDVQQQVLHLYETGIALARDVREHIALLATVHGGLQVSIAAMKSTVDSVRASWVDFAKEISKDDGSKLPVDMDVNWIEHLTCWSNLIEMCVHSMPLLGPAIERFLALHDHMQARLPALLDKVPTLCFDLWGDLRAGVLLEEDARSLHNLRDEVCVWLESYPTWNSSELYSIMDQIGSGQVYYNRDGTRHNVGTDPNSVDVAREECVQVGIDRFDFGHRKAIGTRLNAGDPHRANRIWEPRCRDKHRLFEVEFYDSRLSWIQIPDKLLDRVQFSWTTFDSEGLNKDGRYWPRVFAPGMEEQTPTKSDRNMVRQWIVKFPRPFATDNVDVRPWILDMNIKGESVATNGINLEVDEISKEKFRITVKVAFQADLWYLRIGYVAYEKNISIGGFHIDTYRVVVPYVYKQAPRHRYKPSYFPFPPGTFHRRPAVAAMMSLFSMKTQWNYRADVRFAVTRDGVVVQGASWSDTIIMELKFQILAISND